MSLPLTTLIEVGGLRFLITDKPSKSNVPLFIDVFKKLGVVALVRVCQEDDYDTHPIQEAGVKCYVSSSAVCAGLCTPRPGTRTRPLRCIWGLQPMRRPRRSCGAVWVSASFRFSIFGRLSVLSLSLSALSLSLSVSQALPFDDGSPPPDAIIDRWLDIIKEVNFPARGGGGGGAKKPAAGKDEVKQAPCIAIHCVAGLGRAPLMVVIALVTAGMPYTKAVELIRSKRCVVNCVAVMSGPRCQGCWRCAFVPRVPSTSDSRSLHRSFRSWCLPPCQ